MDSQTIPPELVSRIQGSVGHHGAYFRALMERMEAQRFPQNDRLYVRVRAVREAIGDLNMCLHYLTVPRGVGYPRERGRSNTLEMIRGQERARSHDE